MTLGPWGSFPRNESRRGLWRFVAGGSLEGGSEGRERAEEEAGRDRFQLCLPLPDLSSPRAIAGGKVSPSLSAHHPPVREEGVKTPRGLSAMRGPIAVIDGGRGEGAAVSSLAAAVRTPWGWAWGTTSVHCRALSPRPQGTHVSQGQRWQWGMGREATPAVTFNTG